MDNYKPLSIYLRMYGICELVEFTKKDCSILKTPYLKKQPYVRTIMCLPLQFCTHSNLPFNGWYLWRKKQYISSRFTACIHKNHLFPEADDIFITVYWLDYRLLDQLRQDASVNFHSCLSSKCQVSRRICLIGEEGIMGKKFLLLHMTYYATCNPGCHVTRSRVTN